MAKYLVQFNVDTDIRHEVEVTKSIKVLDRDSYQISDLKVTRLTKEIEFTHEELRELTQLVVQAQQKSPHPLAGVLGTLRAKLRGDARSRYGVSYVSSFESRVKQRKGFGSLLASKREEASSKKSSFE